MLVVLVTTLGPTLGWRLPTNLKSYTLYIWEGDLGFELMTVVFFWFWLRVVVQRGGSGSGVVDDGGVRCQSD